MIEEYTAINKKYRTLSRRTYDKVTELTKQHNCVQAV